MPIHFENSRRRLDRAYEHATSFISEWNLLSDGETVKAVVRKDSHAGWYIAEAVLSPNFITRLGQSRLSLYLGEMAYQLRAALDGLIWDAAIYAGGNESSTDVNRLEFPILNGKDRSFQRCAIHKFGLPKQLVDWIESVQPNSAEKQISDPDHGLGKILESIHDLARFDRHRRLRLVGVVPFDCSITVATQPPGGTVVARDWMNCDFLEGKNDFIRFRVSCPGGLVPYALTFRANATFEVVCENVVLYGTEDIGSGLTRFVRAIEHVMNVFEEKLFQS